MSGAGGGSGGGGGGGGEAAAPAVPNPVWPIKDSDGYITVPFAYGSMALWQGKRAPEFQTHRWHVYLRGGHFLLRHGPMTEALIAGANNEDLTPLIERVIFQLHPSFNNPTRVVDTAPFHVTELGWGEFDIGIKIFFHEGPESGIDLRHNLQLFPKGEQNANTMKKPVISERYDELVLNQPSESLLQRIHMCNNRLVTGTSSSVAGSYASLEPHFTPFYFHDELLRMQAARRRVQAETELLKKEFEQIDSEHTMLTEEVRRLEAPK